MPSLQPEATRRSGIGRVATISLEITTMVRRSSGSMVDQAFIAMTTFSAVTMPRGVTTRGGRPRWRLIIGVRS